jgi:hypothetical protein
VAHFDQLDSKLAFQRADPIQIVAEHLWRACQRQARNRLSQLSKIVHELRQDLSTLNVELSKIED